MAKHKLTQLKVKNLREAGKYGDGGGLQLVVSDTGAKKWVLRYTVKGTGQRKELGLGGFPSVSLAAARVKAEESRQLATQGSDPKSKKTELNTSPTFTACAARYIRAHRAGWSNSKHKRQWPRSLKPRMYGRNVSKRFRGGIHAVFV
jgi:hypothetical protein